MTTDYDNVDIPRDRLGRPMIMQPNGKRTAYRRCTTFVGCLEDTYGLQQWMKRQVVYGIGQNNELALAASNTDPNDKTGLGQIAEQAMEAAGSGAAAELGTQIHRWAELLDLGQAPTDENGYRVADHQADLDAYQAATQHISFTGIETFRVNDEWKVAGTADRIGLWRGRPTIMDIKTGSIDYPAKMAMQLAMYARMTPYDIPTDTRTADPEPLDLNRGIIIHLPAGEGRCDLYEIDLAKGWGACLIARQVWSWRSTKNLTKQVDPHSDTPQVASWELLITNAESLDRLREIWTRAEELGQLTDDLKKLAQARSRRLAA